MLTSVRTASLRGLLGAAVLVGAQLLAAAAPVQAITWIDPCILDASACSTLTIAPFGNGTGTVSSTATAGGVGDLLITCRRTGAVTYGACSHRYYVGTGKSRTIYLADRAALGSQVCYVDSCVGTSYTHAVVIFAGTDATMAGTEFRLDHPEKLSVSFSDVKSIMYSSPAGITCGTACSADFAFGASITLNFELSPDTVFRGWSDGPCHGQGLACTFMIGTDTSISADIVSDGALKVPPTPSPTPKTTPKPTPKPTATPAAKATAGPTVSQSADATADPSVAPIASSSAPPVEPLASATADGSAAPVAAPAAGPVDPTDGGDGSTLVILAGAIVLAGLLIGLAILAGLRGSRRADGTRRADGPAVS